jgi:hypothetical protein
MLLLNKMDETLVDQMQNLRKKIMTLEWDKKLRQINFSKNTLLEEYKQQLTEIEDKIKKNG